MLTRSSPDFWREALLRLLSLSMIYFVIKSVWVGKYLDRCLTFLFGWLLVEYRIIGLVDH